MIIGLTLALSLQLAPLSAQRAVRKAADEHWIPTWATAQQLVRQIPQGQAAQSPAQPPAASAAAPSASAAATVAATPTITQASSAQATTTPAIAAPGPAPAAPPLPPLQTLKDQTIRMILRTSIGGSRVRVRLSNAFNATPVDVGAAHIAVRATGSAIVPATDRALTFGGRAAFRMMPGVVVVSDPVDLAVAPLADLAVSLYLTGDTGPPTTHATGLRPTYVSGGGDFSSAPEIPDATVRMSYYWLAGVEVAAPSSASLIVAFGDSITDGSRSTPDTHNTWPAILATRLAANKATANLAVVNQGIGGNRVLTDGSNFAGVSALARLDRDVLSLPGVRWLMVLEGINDIGNGTSPTAQYPVTTEQLIWGLQQIVNRARTHGIKVIGCTLTPYEGAGYFRETGETIRQAVNTWIRTSGTFDAVADFDAATRDPSNPRRLRPEFDPGDHLHPNDAGYRAMAESVELRIFSR
jgi:lysophospholipase L1-like esterase